MVGTMGELVQTLRGEDIDEKLRQAYAALAKAYLRHRSRGIDDIDDASLQALQAAVLESEERVDLSEAMQSCEWIKAPSERPGEIFDQLCHMSVLIGAATGLATCGLYPNICAPTQQSADTDGQRIPDLGGTDWFLEAYGGVNYKNGGKLAKDLRSLARWSGTSSTSRTFLACRKSAWPRKSISESEFTAITHRCPKVHGGPFRATAESKLFHASSEVYVVQVRGITITEESQGQSQ
jgi:hypothetical protein